MAFELDPCRIRTTEGELLVQGFVREHWGTGAEVEVDHEAGGWIQDGDAVLLEVLSSVRGACTFDAVVVASGERRVELCDLVLRETVQMRSAVRVPTSIPVTLHPVGPPARTGEDAEPDVQGVLIDVSATGVRVRLAEPLDQGTRFTFRLDATRVPLDLQLEVLRGHEIGGATAVGCRLVDVSERETDELFRFVLEEQRRLLAQRAAEDR
ncbi:MULTISPECIES: PilZ domain-containing protein [unclassified Actinotalea]|uniref:PilZ domain-containing protein n=1 Tax=unclassified Actinotalea TaxID=2638618 RepID=UPI0015F70826|nr:MULTISPECIES: PilZ domain-containing protein [unclassified Actinotalea]